MLTNEALIEFGKLIHQQNVEAGWWDDPNVCLLTKVHLITTEVCEGTEGARKDLFDDHLPTRKMEEVELADALIRTLDLGTYLGLTIDATLLRARLGRCRRFLPDTTVGAMHFLITRQVVLFGNVIMAEPAAEDAQAHSRQLNQAYTALIAEIIRVSNARNYSLFEAAEEKLAYNRHRADHTREARAAANGKKF